MRKITSFLLSMILALVAIPIQAAIQADVIIDQEFSSLAELEGKAFAIVNKETGKALFGPKEQNLGYDVLTTAFSTSNSGYYFKLETPAEDAEDATIASCYLLRLQTPAGENYNIWGKPGYLNSQAATGWCSFILGLNNQNGQDIKNGAVFDIQYVEGKGFTLLNKGTGLYLNDNAPAKYEEPVYWTFCTLKFAAEAVEPTPVIVYTDLSVEDYYTWTSFDATAEKVNQCPTTLVLNESTSLPFGDGNVGWLNYVDLSDAVNMVITATEGTPRLLFNRVEDGGTVNVELPRDAAKYWTEVDNGDGSKTYTVDVKKIVANFGFAHLHCIKGNWANTTITSVKIGQHKVSSNIPGITVTADKKWATYISQVDRSIPSGLRAFTCDGIGAKNALELTEIHISIPANTPCILYNTTADNITIDRNFGDIKAEKDSYKVGLLTGVYRKTYVPAGSYILQRKGEDTGFFICDQDNTITVARNRCYLTVDAVNAPAAAPSRSFIFNEPGTTGIPSVQGSIPKMMNGSDIYDAQGRKLKSMQKGINIINGVKVRIK